MKAKLAVPILLSLLLLIAGGYQWLNMNQRNAIQAQQLADYERHVADLMNEIEAASRSRLELERGLDALEDESNALRSQLRVASDRLAVAETRIDPDYQALESEIEQRLRREMRRQEEAEMIDPRVEMLRQLTSMEPTELGELMSLQGQFGPFLRELDVDDARMEVVVAALGNLVAEQNQARQEIMVQMQSQQIGRQEMREDLMALMGRESQREALAYVLNEDELAVWDEVQQQQQAGGRGRFRAMSISSGAVDGGLMQIEGQSFQGGSGTVIALPADPAAADGVADIIIQAIPAPDPR